MGMAEKIPETKRMVSGIFICKFNELPAAPGSGTKQY